MITFDQIEGGTTSSNLERGKYYYNQGYIRNLKIINGKFIQATVSGTYIYKVFLEFNENGLNVHCTCPYDSKGYCKHAVATSLLLMDRHKTEPYKIMVPEWQEIFYKFFFGIQKLFSKFIK